MIPRFHRAAGVLLALPLVLWMATGLLFHVKHRYAEAYEPLAVPAPPVGLAVARIAPAQLVARGLVDGAAGLTLARDPRGGVAYYGTLAGRPVAVDAASGLELPPADDALALEWARRAVGGSAHARRYGEAGATRPAELPSRLTGTSDPALAVDFSGGKTVIVDRITGEMTQHGALNDWIDLTYRVHYLQWTPWPRVNVALVLVAVLLVLWLAASGLTMAWRRPSSR